MIETTSFAYDGLDRLSTTTWPDSSTETLSYDADSNVTKRVTRKGDAISFAYDTLNRPCTKTYAPAAVPCGGTSSNYLVSYSYDLVGHLIAANDNPAAPITTVAGSASYAETMSYDALNHLINASWSPALTQATPTATAVTFDFQYDATNRRTNQTATDNSWWSYPTTASSTGYTANNLDQYTAVGSASPTYDADGNLTYDGTDSYCYDAESRLTEILSAGTCASPTTVVASYAYDAQGRRKSKTVGSNTTIYVTDAGNREVLEYDGTSGAVGTWYAYGPGPNDVLNRMNGAGTDRQTLIPDVQGSIVASLDASTGALSKTGYQPFGENPSLSSGSFQYIAARFDPESRFYYMRTRMYRTDWGRFQQPDTIGFAGGNNLYAYVHNDPLNRVDPLGLCDNPQGCGGGSSNQFISTQVTPTRTNSTSTPVQLALPATNSASTSGVQLAASYFDTFGTPNFSVHAMERMNQSGISPTQLNGALSASPVPGTSPGTMNFVGGGVTAVVNEEGLIVTVY